jgi:hypothetical protein
LKARVGMCFNSTAPRCCLFSHQYAGTVAREKFGGP